jgi:CRP/FNR family transcriptional regulator
MLRARWLTQQEMATQLGTVREVVGRALKGLEAKGLVRLDRHRIVIVDREGLEDLAGL